MYAIVEVGGKQYRVQEGQEVYVEKTSHQVGEEFPLERVLLVKKGEDVLVGTPLVEKAQVKVKVLEEVRGPKIKGFKYKPKKNYRRRWGHRQTYHKLQVLSIEVG